MRVRNYLSEYEQISHGTLNLTADLDQPDGSQPEQSEESIAALTDGLLKDTASSPVAETRY